MQGILIRYFNHHRHRHCNRLRHHSLLQHSILLDPMAAYVGPQYRIMEIIITNPHQHHYLIAHTICIHKVRISSHIHLNQNREHNHGIMVLPILRVVSMVDMTEDTMDTIGDLILMIEGITLMIGVIALMVEGITLMMGCIASMIDGTTFMIGGKCTMKLWMVEGFLHSFHQVLHFQITLKRHPTNFIVDDHWSLHKVHVLGGLCLIGDPSTLPIPGRQWSHMFPMEVGGGMEGAIMIDIIDD